MKRVKFDSTNIESIGYDEDIKTLEIEFKGGAVYQYKNVTFETFIELSKAPSIGTYFSKHIKNDPKKYPFTKIEKTN